MRSRRLSRIAYLFLIVIFIVTSFLVNRTASAAFPPVPSSFGVEVYTPSLDNASLMDLIDQAGIYWARAGIIDWSLIEPVKSDPPVYHWEFVNDGALQNTSIKGLKVIATVRYAPAWAQKSPGIACGPIKESEFIRFAQFMQAVVSRYKDYVKYWELGNEPDIDPALVSPISVYGCWGDQSDDYYGGGYYADMLQVVYPAIKAADPQAQVLNGGLLLDCDPDHPPVGKDCKPAKFLEGILRHNGANDGGNYFDIVSFHGYPLYMNTSGITPLGWDEHNPSWVNQTGDDGVGGVVMGKIHFIRNLLIKYGLSKPLMLTEGALVCPESNDQCNPPTNAFYESQADYVVWLYVRNLAAGIQTTIWFMFEDPNWRHCGLLDNNGQPKLAFNALKFLTQELRNANYGGTVTRYPDLRGFEFYKTGKRIWVLWAPDEQPHAITLDSETLKVYDKYGNDITPPDKNLIVSKPIYVELSPDTLKPSVSWALPVLDDQPYIIRSLHVHLEVNAADNVGISKVQFFRWDAIKLQPVDIGFDYTSPYTWDLDTSVLNYDVNEIDVVAYDRAGNRSDQKRIYLYRWYSFYLNMPFIRR